MTKERSHPQTPAQILVGCQTWGYDDWKTLRDGPTVFFPLGTRPEEYLAFYSKIFDTVEVNTTFYSIPKPGAIESWYEQTPDHFIFSLKMPRNITHEYQMSEPSFPAVEEFLLRVAALKNKLGVILIQLPGSFKMREGTIRSLRDFLGFLRRLHGGELRFAVEFRSPEWFNWEIFALLAEENTALCLGDSEYISRNKMLDSLSVVSADHAYFRFDGLRDMTGSFDHIRRPKDESMNFWAAKIKEIENKGKESFVYFSDFFEGHSPGSAIKFRRMLGQKFAAPEEYNETPSLF